jgi:hypothetical protein
VLIISATSSERLGLPSHQEAENTGKKLPQAGVLYHFMPTKASSTLSKKTFAEHLEIGLP